MTLAEELRKAREDWHAERREIFTEALKQANLDVSHAARLLEMDPANFRRALRRSNYPGYPFDPKWQKTSKAS